MWPDIEKRAEGLMRSADQAIRAAEQATQEPPWDGFCGLVRVCDDEELKERGVIRVVVRPQASPSAQQQAGSCGNGSGGGVVGVGGGGGGASTTAAAAAGDGLSDWLKPHLSAAALSGQQQQQQQRDAHGVLTPWEQLDPNSTEKQQQQQQHVQQHTTAQPHPQQSHQQQQQQQQEPTPIPQLKDPGQQQQQGPRKSLLTAGSFGSSEEGKESGDDADLGLRLIGTAAGAGAAGTTAGAGWVAACFLDTELEDGAAAASAADGAKQGHEQQQQQQQECDADSQQQQEDVDRLLQQVFAAAEQEVQAEDSAAAAVETPAPAAAAQPRLPQPTHRTAGRQPPVSPTAADAAAAAAEQSLQGAPDTAAAAEFGGHVDRLAGLIDLDNNGSSSTTDAGCGGLGVAAQPGVDSSTSHAGNEAGVLLAAADEAAVLAAKFGPPGVPTTGSGTGGVQAAVAAGAAAGAAGQAAGAAGGEAAAGQCVGQDPPSSSHMDAEVSALLAAAAEEVALEAKHGGPPGEAGAAGAAAAADVAARVSALGVDSAAALQQQGSEQDAEDGHGEELGGSDGHATTGSSVGSSDGSSDSGSYASDEDEWLDELPVAPGHAAVQQPAAGTRQQGRPGRQGRGRRKGGACG